ncbi:UDP-glucuronic acid decarboxylase family protein [Brucella tritici]|uniref:UDP-glucuronic acid decarboxylase family protein n=1 Tax=Brucella tritici TaxID=94626 RepID=UPI0015919EF9|nr:UDP-glucuronic acid decarboxylase family protein [Brucella tritici]
MTKGSPRVSLVTGGAGFIGFNLCKRLLAQGDKVVCIDDMTSGMPQHVDELRRHPDFQFIRHDVCKPVELKVDRIFNLACPASPPAYQSDPIKTTLTSVLGVRNMLELALANGARILHSSTSEVYGDPLEHPQRESYNGNVKTMGPRACYDEGKRCAETLLHDYHMMHGVDVRIVRIFNTYGPGMRADDGRAVSNFVTQALTGQDLTIYGTGNYTRSFCYVDDLIDGMLRLMELDGDHPEPVNLGNPHEIAIRDLADMVLAETGSCSHTIHLANAIDDPRIRCPDITRATQLLNWKPKVRIEEGLKETIDYFRRVLAEPEVKTTRER